MPGARPGLALVVAFGSVLLAGCSEVTDVSADVAEHAAVEHVEGSELSRLVLSAAARQRLDISTDRVRSVDGLTVIPYAAVLYTADGATWTYVVDGPTGFLRHHIAIERISGTQAGLSAGPPPGAHVVTVGAAELLGTELDVGH